jgi:DNA invertase Pin-like site-specific DNA recombinase
MRAVLYARSACTTQGTELESQLEVLRNQAASRGMEIIEEFRDPGYSGLRRHRPGLDRRRELAERSGFDVLLTCRPDRLARDSVLLERILEELAQLGIRTLFLEGTTTDEGLSSGMRAVVAARAELERVRLPKEIVALSSRYRLGYPRRSAVRIAEGDSIDQHCDGFPVSRAGGK